MVSRWQEADSFWVGPEGPLIGITGRSPLIISVDSVIPDKFIGYVGLPTRIYCVERYPPLSYLSVGLRTKYSSLRINEHDQAAFVPNENITFLRTRFDAAQEWKRHRAEN